MKDMYGLSYLLFKHGSMSKRRLRQVVLEFTYRTVLTMLIQLAFCVWNGFSTVSPYGTFFFAMLMVVLSSIQFFVQGILHVEYGFQILNRIFGEYQFNTIKTLTTQDLVSVILSATFDALVFNVFYYFRFYHIKTQK